MASPSTSDADPKRLIRLTSTQDETVDREVLVAQCTGPTAQHPLSGMCPRSTGEPRSRFAETRARQAAGHLMQNDVGGRGETTKHDLDQRPGLSRCAHAFLGEEI